LSLTYNTLQPFLGDRVVNLSCLGVPLGLKGTVVSIHQNAKFVDVSRSTCKAVVSSCA
jgi:hypothetical protein